MRSRHPRRRAAVSHDRWLVPYADFVTLLFAFFTALYAVTLVDASRLPDMADGLREAMGSAPAQRTAAIAPDNATAAAPPDITPLPPVDADTRTEVAQALAADLAAGRLELTEDRRGLVLAVPEAYSFETGRDTLSEDAERLMARVANLLKTLPNAVRVEGHTDDTPIHTPRFTSNWDLSTARATRVVAFFITTAGLAPTRLSAAGYSEYHPRAGNDTAEGRARNRRVDIVILNQATVTSEEPLPGAILP